ncbi:hypothetical protein EJ06DRAFT_522455 [Trichodelitschia bisporula]|uniref:G-protein coupled receptors family 2 profile 2 domain-containing protein n=1 Tax=Trichodelitschia bisporula TaxID=703511 RepID=A0A6G1HUN4_9PEZI|nr:hypothetical protein EJ06DRAFT_522455 [Trichodelitschia bisporula]
MAALGARNGIVSLPQLQARDTTAWHMLSPHEQTVLEAIERTMSVLSILGFLAIFSTYMMFRSFRRKLFNKFMFCASFGNVGTNLGTIIATSGIRKGAGSPGCRMQAFMIDWLMPGDALWAMCMALTIFFQFHTSINIESPKLALTYAFVCYCIPLVPALTFLIMDVTRGKAYYGDATIWCWIGHNHNSLRISSFYGPVWGVIIITMFLYAYTASTIMGRSGRRLDKTVKLSALQKHTQISQTSEPRDSALDGSSIANADGNGGIPAPVPKTPSNWFMKLLSTQNTLPCRKICGIATRPATVTTVVSTPPTGVPYTQQKSRTNHGVRRYALVAFMIFIALLVVWVPATVNRVWGLVSLNHTNFAINAVSAAVLPLQGFLNGCVYLFFSRVELAAEWARWRESWTARPKSTNAHAEASNKNVNAEAVQALRSARTRSSDAEDGSGAP